MNKLLIPLFCGLLCQGCITEVNGIERDEAPSAPRKPASPLARAESEAARHIERMRYETGTQLYQTMQTIASFEVIARKPLIDALPGADGRMRANLIYLLGYVGGSPAQPILAQHLADPEPIVRLEAAAAILGLGDMAGVPVLLPLLEEESVQLRFKANEALTKLTRQDFGFEASAPKTVRAASVTRWNAWWETQRERLLFHSPATSERVAASDAP